MNGHIFMGQFMLQVLRNQSFEPNCLVRRSSPEGEDVDVSLWTNHRVMEWLRAVDLAEYAPNLRGSGKSGNYQSNLTSSCLMYTSSKINASVYMPVCNRVNRGKSSLTQTEDDLSLKSAPPSIYLKLRKLTVLCVKKPNLKKFLLPTSR